MESSIHPYTLRWRTFELALGYRTAIMGIVNVTPDSFSDGGRFYTVDAAVAQAERLVEAGADIIDIGGESTRPYSQDVSPDEELERVLPVIERLAARIPVPISIDTTKAGGRGRPGRRRRHDQRHQRVAHGCADGRLGRP
jgi:dihydropteroate synthase